MSAPGMRGAHPPTPKTTRSVSPRWPSGRSSTKGCGPVPVSNLEALRARDDLLAVAASWAALQARLLPAPGKGEPVSGSAEPRSPIDIGVSDLMYRIEQHARFLGKMLLDETVDWQPTTSTMPGLLQEVAMRYGHFVSDDGKTGLDFCGQAHGLRRKAGG